MTCLPLTLRTVLPNWIQSFFLSDNDDTSFWGGNEEQPAYENSDEVVPHKTSTYVTPEAAIYRLDDSNSTRCFKNSKKFETKPHTFRTAGQFAFQTRMFDTVFY